MSNAPLRPRRASASLVVSRALVRRTGADRRTLHTVTEHWTHSHPTRARRDGRRDRAQPSGARARGRRPLPRRARATAELIAAKLDSRPGKPDGKAQAGRASLAGPDICEIIDDLAASDPLRWSCASRVHLRPLEFFTTRHRGRQSARTLESHLCGPRRSTPSEVVCRTRTPSDRAGRSRNARNRGRMSGPTVAVVGGGSPGSSRTSLAASCEVTLFESAASLGGKLETAELQGYRSTSGLMRSSPAERGRAVVPRARPR